MSSRKRPEDKRRREIRALPNAVAIELIVVEPADERLLLSLEGEKESCPYETYEFARSEMDAVANEAVAPNDVALQSEQEIGHGERIDVETDASPERQLPPHLQDS